MSFTAKRLLVTAAAAVLSFAGVALAPATASAAPLNPCAHPGWIEDFPTEGYLTGEPTNIRSGPYLDCAVNKVGHAGDYAIYMCWREGSTYGGTNRWTFVYSSGSRGWVTNSLLAYGGSPYHC
ncbi:SH3 domain-containing protein [Amycolatopsis sp. OK19-0408]|uniref:SH3 domain-containing protein n=1 Tax=Amycolatopsis iheyensis TaxID=2945988 RepID=A0A9X2NG92_9PSEU|nr:SH3 domain-containing protein [Amycolatopsis iheyensis]MCR6486768.1 SH3 domain-containing protein [Amycolatopsis iheyensis]